MNSLGNRLGHWDALTLEIDSALTRVGLFQVPGEGLDNATWGEYELVRAQCIAHAVARVLEKYPDALDRYREWDILDLYRGIDDI